jgi:hypothetical protein
MKKQICRNEGRLTSTELSSFSESTIHVTSNNAIITNSAFIKMDRLSTTCHIKSLDATGNTSGKFYLKLILNKLLHAHVDSIQRSKIRMVFSFFG